MSIHNHMKGRTIKSVMTDGNKLIIFTTDSHRFDIIWVKDKPVLESQNVEIMLDSVALTMHNGY